MYYISIERENDSVERRDGGIRDGFGVRLLVLLLLKILVILLLTCPTDCLVI